MTAEHRQQPSQRQTRLSKEETREKDSLLKWMEDNGDYDRIKHDLYAKLLLNDVWRARMYQHLREIVQQQESVSEITFDELSRTLVERGPSAIPDSIKDEIMIEISRSFPK